MSNDVAGATFMAAATSAPELFVNVIGTFITEGDIGIGTVVGSAVFNILAVAACCGIVTQMEVPLDWWPLTRDCLAYGITVSILIGFIHDERVEWYEALILVVLYVVYIAVMYFDKTFQKCARGGLEYASSRRKSGVSTRSYSLRDHDAIEAQVPFRPENHMPAVEHQQHNGNLKMSGSQDRQQTKPTLVSRDLPQEESRRAPANGSKANEVAEFNDGAIELDVVMHPKGDNSERVDLGGEQANTAENEDNSEVSLWCWPKKRGWFQQTTWVITWPINLVFMLTIPDCERPFFKKWFPLTFLMCIMWIGSLSYVVAWMITIIGDTLKIPDSVMGITFLAAGTSVPEAVSSVIVAKQGHGSMGISNSIGSNTFDILLCLGLPWLIKAAFLPTQPGHHWVAINSAGLEYSAISLLSTLLMLYVTFWLNKFKLDAKVGRACLFIYVIFLILASLIELNVFFPVNLPTCRR